jgi:hypothetical protein
MGAFPSSNFTPQVQSKYQLEGLFSNPKFAQLTASGLFEMDTVENQMQNGGDFCNIPSIVQVDDFARVDITSTTAAVGTRISSYAGKLPVLRDYSHKSLTETDEIRTNEDFLPKLSMSAGNKVAKRSIVMLDKNLKAVLTAQNTHIKDITAASTKTVNVEALLDTKVLLGDRSQDLSIMLVHSKAINNLYKQLGAGSGYAGNAVVAGDMIRSGALNTILGVGTIVVSDDLTADAGATSSAGDDIYWTYMFVPQSVFFGYQAAPRFARFVDTRVPSTLITYSWKMDYTIGAKGFSYNSTANPTDAAFGTSGNYSVQTEDHRNVGIVSLKSLVA